MSISDGFSGSFGDSQLDVDDNTECFQVYGMHFCGACRNMMIPNKEQGEKLEFFCRSCDKKEIDFTDYKGNDCVIYNKQLKPGIRKVGLDPEMVLDHTMPRIKYECKQCGGEESVYTITADESESSLIMTLICVNVDQGFCDSIVQLPMNKCFFQGAALDRQKFQLLKNTH